MIQLITFVCGVVGFVWIVFQWCRIFGRWFMLAAEPSLSAWYKVPPFCFLNDKLLGAWLAIATTDTVITLVVMRLIVKTIPSASAAYIGAVVGLAASVIFRVMIGGALVGPRAVAR